MSARLSWQTLLLADRLAQQLLMENKGDVAKPHLVERLLDSIHHKEIVPEQMLEPEHICQIVTNIWWHQQTLIRRRCEKQGDLFRPQMLVPIAPGILTRFGTGGFAAAVGYQSETNRKTEGAIKILERARKINEHCNILIGHLVQHPKWDIARVEVECLGYQWKVDDDQPFQIISAAQSDGEDDEEDE